MRRFVALCLIGLFLAMPFVVAGDNILPHSSSATVTASGTCVIRVQYLDGCPRSDADVFIVNGNQIGTTDSNGQVSCNSLSPGPYTIRAVYQGSNFGPDTFLLVPDGATITADYEITPPNITILSPQNSSYYVSVPLVFTVYDFSPISWIGYSLDGQANITITGNMTLSGFQTFGSQSVVVYSNDTFGNMGSSGTVYFTLHANPVRVQYLDGTPRPGASVWIIRGNAIGVTDSNGQVSCDSLGPTGWNANIRAYYPGNSQFGYDTQLVVPLGATITADYEITPPAIEILFPLNLTYFNSLVPLNFTVYDYLPVSWIGYSLDDAANVTVVSNMTLNLADGPHHVAVYANDTFGNMGSSGATYFAVDTSPPTITVLSPQSQTYTSNTVPLTYAVNDFSPISWTGYSLDGQPNMTMTGNTTLNISFGTQIHSIIVFSNDTFGNMGQSGTVRFAVQRNSCIVRVQYLDGAPRSGATVWIIGGNFIGTTDSNGQVSCDSLSPGGYNIRAYYPGNSQFGPDTGLIVPIGATITADYEITPPNIMILSPQNQTYAGRLVPLNFTVYDYSPISWMGYSLDGQANVTVTGNTTLAGLSDGSHRVIVYANDTYGNMGSSSMLYFTVDTTAPSVLILSPQNLTYHSSSVPLTFTVSESTSWVGYSLDGQSNTTATGNTTISVADGKHRIAVYANNSFGNMGSSGIIYFSIDTISPTVTVLSPQNATYSSDYVPLTFTVSEPVSWMGYSLDSGANVTVSGNATLTLADGAHRVVVYANDTFGNMGSSATVSFTVDTTLPDLAVTNVTITNYAVAQGEPVSVNVTVENLGDDSETFNVTVYANATAVATLRNLTLPSHDSITVSFTWNTFGFASGNYTVSAYAWPVPGETSTADNTFTDGTVQVAPSNPTPIASGGTRKCVW